MDLDAEANTGDMIQYKMSVLFGDKWIDTDWTTGEWGRSQVCCLVPYFDYIISYGIIIGNLRKPNKTDAIA